MIIGIGSDIFEIARMKRELGNLKAVLFTSGEIEYCDSRHYPERHYAARFAAKEALFKALSTGFRPDMNWHEAEIKNNENGQPYFTLYGKTSEIADRLGTKNIFVSLSHTEEWAAANVILEA
jgi:holo-[acyl-carrier protein] synthase